MARARNSRKPKRANPFDPMDERPAVLDAPLGPPARPGGLKIDPRALPPGQPHLSAWDADPDPLEES